MNKDRETFEEWRARIGEEMGIDASMFEAEFAARATMDALLVDEFGPELVAQLHVAEGAFWGPRIAEAERVLRECYEREVLGIGVESVQATPPPVASMIKSEAPCSTTTMPEPIEIEEDLAPVPPLVTGKTEWALGDPDAPWNCQHVPGYIEPGREF